MEKFCIKCGKKIQEDADFCPFCGAGQSTIINNESVNNSAKDMAYNESASPNLLSSLLLMLKDTFKISKRLGRADYWWARLGIFIIGALFCIYWFWIYSRFISYAPAPSVFEAYFIYAMMPFTGFLLLWFAIALITAGIRRLHDIGYSSVLMLLILLPTLGDLIILILCMLPSKQIGNRYID